VTGLVWSYDSESYANGTVGTGRVCSAREVKGNQTREEMQWSLKSYMDTACIVISSIMFDLRYKLQTRPFVKEGARDEEQREGKRIIWSWAPRD
jgi:hypothetical protein